MGDGKAGVASATVAHRRGGEKAVQGFRVTSGRGGCRAEFSGTQTRFNPAQAWIGASEIVRSGQRVVIWGRAESNGSERF